MRPVIFLGLGVLAFLNLLMMVTSNCVVLEVCQLQSSAGPTKHSSSEFNTEQTGHSPAKTDSSAAEGPQAEAASEGETLAFFHRMGAEIAAMDFHYLLGEIPVDIASTDQLIVIGEQLMEAVERRNVRAMVAIALGLILAVILIQTYPIIHTKSRDPVMFLIKPLWLIAVIYSLMTSLFGTNILLQTNKSMAVIKESLRTGAAIETTMLILCVTLFIASALIMMSYMIYDRSPED